MILVDTSAWIEFFRRSGDPVMKSKVGDLITSGKAAYTCPVRYELLQGARPDEIRALKTGMELANRVPVTSAHWDQSADIRIAMRTEGVTVPAMDLLIAVVANQAGLTLYARDAHFEVIGRYIPTLRTEQG